MRFPRKKGFSRGIVRSGVSWGRKKLPFSKKRTALILKEKKQKEQLLEKWAVLSSGGGNGEFRYINFQNRGVRTLLGGGGGKNSVPTRGKRKGERKVYFSINEGKEEAELPFITEPEGE